MRWRTEDQVNVVELQALQRGLESLVEVLAAEANRVDRVLLRAAATVELGRDNQVHALPQAAADQIRSQARSANLYENTHTEISQATGEGCGVLTAPCRSGCTPCSFSAFCFQIPLDLYT